ncbi:hypothetical protein BO70DRAFT_76317 [Aspergillus heteromorphus CBS 117.55]|uniref:Uncharacterized protein n=1 Tax=Aspergillus heteromorphus CBS 117.55 TaxID=1448321 RepID=A0A317WZL9_9EURO|nr:uncharacterized protein BO70DRAFT_76317 [Aspergillus heteromorphus CBS 117.55]PWY90717.1 hypothetical protein BO70DRAFT_76317 [Aspergillus heteromorphus CBS 117.55]
METFTRTRAPKMRSTRPRRKLTVVRPQLFKKRAESPGLIRKAMPDHYSAGINEFVHHFLGYHPSFHRLPSAPSPLEELLARPAPRALSYPWLGSGADGNVKEGHSGEGIDQIHLHYLLAAGLHADHLAVNGCRGDRGPPNLYWSSVHIGAQTSDAKRVTFRRREFD